MNKKLGWIILILAIFFLDFIPGPTDAIVLPLYSMYSGADISAGNLSSIYLDYFIWSTIIGLILLFIGMRLLGWNFKKLFKKMDLGKYNLMVGLAVAVVAIVAFMDVQGMIYWASFSSAEAYTLGQQGPAFWNFFKNIVLAIFLILPITYFLVVNRDKSEAFSIWITSYALWIFGFADILYFVFQRARIPEFLPWLNNHPVIGWISSTLGFQGVTNISLIISVAIGFIIVFMVNKLLKEKF